MNSYRTNAAPPRNEKPAPIVRDVPLEETWSGGTLVRGGQCGCKPPGFFVQLYAKIIGRSFRKEDRWMCRHGKKWRNIGDFIWSDFCP